VLASEGTILERLKRVARKGHIMDMERLTQALQRDLGDMTFYEAYDRTGRIINITVSPVNGFEKPRLLNYLTAPNVLLWSAAAPPPPLRTNRTRRVLHPVLIGHAASFTPYRSAAASSCYLPGFKTPELVARTPDGDLRPYSGVSFGSSSGEPWGSEERLGAAEHTDLPMQRLQELFNVNFFVVSQVCVSIAPPPPPRTKWTRRVPHPVLIGHAASLTPYYFP